jgi:hypothetical protein
MDNLAIDCTPSEDADYFSVYSQESDSEQWALKQQAAALTSSPETFPFKKEVGKAVREAAAAVASDGPSEATSSRRAYAAVAAAREQVAAAAAAGASAQQDGGEPGSVAAAAGERQDVLEQVIDLRYAAQSLSVESAGEGEALLWFIEQCTALLDVSLA